jgi:hypothetical protein
MNNTITSYESLMKEQKRLKEKLEIHKLQIQKDIIELKQELQPALRVATFLGKMAIPDVSTNTALKAGAGLTIEWVVKKLLMSSNPLLRLVVPTLVKNYSSHYIGKAVPFLQKLKDKITRKKTASTLE